MTRFLISGALIGLAHLETSLSFSAWIGVAALAWTVEQTRSPAARAAGLLLAGVSRFSVALFWLLITCRSYVGLPTHLALPVATVLWTACALLAHGPLCVAFYFARSPGRWLLPPAWIGGEWLLETISGGFSCGALLYGQYVSPPVLRALAYFGWYPTLLLVLYAACCLGEASGRRAPKSALAALLVAAFLFALPSIPTSSLHPLAGVSTTAISSWRPPWPVFDANTEIVVWPEGIAARHPDLRTLRSGHRLLEALPPGAPQVTHLLGMHAQDGRRTYNLAVLTDDDGHARQLRAKSLLVPLGERSFFGVQPVGGTFVAGHGFAPMRWARTHVLTLICFEVFSRQMLPRIQEMGDDLWIAVLASDRPFAGSRIAIRQSIGALVLRAVEGHVPAVRASLGGIAAVIREDGTWMTVDPGQSNTAFLVRPREAGDMVHRRGSSAAEPIPAGPRP